MGVAEEAKHISIPLYEELLEKIRSRYPKGGGVSGEIARLQTIYNIIINKTRDVKRVEEILENLHPFYWRLVEIEFNRADIEDSIKCLSKARKFAYKFWERYRFEILAVEDVKELRRLSAEGRGRILSLFKRCRKGLVILKNLVLFLQKLPSINPGEPIVIVAGPPNSGKSTFVRSVSKARVEISNYPFTTKQITVGHRDYGLLKVQIIDTPGLLDRPINEMNQVERRAVAALSELNGAILFLVDPMRGAYMSLERQARLAENLRSIIGGKPLYIGVNKVDAVEKEDVERAVEIFSNLVERRIAVDIYLLSAINMENAVKVLDSIVLRVFKVGHLLS